MQSWLLSPAAKQQHKQPTSNHLPQQCQIPANKTEELRSEIYYNCFVQECCLLIVTESWLHPNIPNASVEVLGQTLHHQDHNQDSSKGRVGGLYACVLQDWCHNSRIKDGPCSLDLEAMSI